MTFHLNNRGSVYISCLFLGLSSLIWIKYLFFYNPYHGAAILLWTIPISLVGIIPAFYIKSLPLRWLLIGAQLIMAISFLLSIVAWAFLGA